MVAEFPGKQAVGPGAQFFRQVPVGAQVVPPEEARLFQFCEIGKGNAESPIQAKYQFIDAGLQVRIEALARGLRQKGRAFNFFSSHVPASAGNWLGRVRCFEHRALPAGYRFDLLGAGFPFCSFE